MVPAVLLPRQRLKLARGAKDEEHVMSQQINARVAVVGIDIGKNSFHIVGQDGRGAIVLRQKWSRSQVEARFANMSSCLIGMEACVGAHHLSRQLRALGHDARLMPAKYVRPYSKGQKNDFRDAEAIAEAVAAADDEVRRHEDRRSTRSTGAPPGTGTAGQPTHRDHQSNPRLLVGARHRGSARTLLPAGRVFVTAGG
jgi:Transposase